MDDGEDVIGGQKMQKGQQQKTAVLLVALFWEHTRVQQKQGSMQDYGKALGEGHQKVGYLDLLCGVMSAL